MARVVWRRRRDEAGAAAVSFRPTGSCLAIRPPRSRAARITAPTTGFGPCRPCATSHASGRRARQCAQTCCRPTRMDFFGPWPVRRGLAHRHGDACGAARVIANRGDVARFQLAPHRHTTRLDHRQITCSLTDTRRALRAGRVAPGWCRSVRGLPRSARLPRRAGSDRPVGR